MSLPKKIVASLKVFQKILFKMSGLICNVGTVIRRHRIHKPAPNDDKYFTVADLNLGNEVTLYGRVIRLINCDAFTANFITKLGIRLNPTEEFPTDSYSEVRQTLKVCVHQKLLR
jgi:hypothetical protein